MTYPDQLLTERQAADLLGTTPGAINVARARRVGAYADLPYVRIGRAIRFRLTDVLAYIEARVVVPAAL
ncbi:MAG: helix-turn-helix domain-containing protein [Candidatus Sericytochromatia bacterium]|nr:helix-turn-helix domain-containing protein [Candidatus Tanganyikabacteria bacterium]